MMAAECILILTGRLGFKMDISVRPWIDLPPGRTGISFGTRQAAVRKPFPYILILQKPEVS
jgi:hypothetical protein